MTLVSERVGEPEGKPNPNSNPNPNPNEQSNTPNITNNNQSADENWGYDLYPERKGAKYKPSWTKRLLGMEGREGLDKIKCERNVYSCIINNPIVKLMMAGLNASGCFKIMWPKFVMLMQKIEINFFLPSHDIPNNIFCSFDIRRHISCEVCDVAVSGGYDPHMNQIVVCQNTARSESMVGGVMIHEMIHMFDYCRNELDFKNLEHLACTEIRAANLTHCSFMSAWVQGSASPINVRQTHQECVKTKAMSSVIAARNVTPEQARAAIEKVFPQCYPDMEPIGRRIRRNSGDMHKAYFEGHLYGYDT